MLLRKESIDRWAARGPAATPIDLEAKETDAARVPGKLELRERFLTADGQTATPLEQEALLGTNDLVESNFLDRCARIDLRVVWRLPTGNGIGARTGACRRRRNDAAVESLRSPN